MNLLVMIYSAKKAKIYPLKVDKPFSECIYLLELQFLDDMKEEATGHMVLSAPSYKKYKVHCNKGLDEFEVWGDSEISAFAKASVIFQHRYENKLPQNMEIKK